MPSRSLGRRRRGGERVPRDLVALAETLADAPGGP